MALELPRTAITAGTGRAETRASNTAAIANTKPKLDA
jgi:hypothetical protein